MRSFVLPIVAVIAALVSGSALADVVKINVGPTLNPFFLRLTCGEIAAERGGVVVKTERSGKDKTGTCFINMPNSVNPTPKPGIVATPGGVIRQPMPTIQQPEPVVKLEMVEVGRLWSQDHANERCRALAKRRNATWTGAWQKHGRNEEAKCQLKFVPKPEFIVKEFDAGRIWSDAHARQKCPRIAEKNGGSWTGNWKNNPQDTNKSVCAVRVKAEPEKVVKRFKTTKIWSEAHAKQHCKKVAKQNKGEWTGSWRHARDGDGSICMIEVAAKQSPDEQSQAVQQPPVAVSPSKNIRDVKAGAIWDQAHAERKCPVVARNAKGSWTKRWTKTGPGNESVCEVDFGGGITAQPSAPTVPATNNTRTRNVAAGEIWDDKQAATKCPVIAANNKAKWTGNWTKTGPGNISVCEIRVTVATTTPSSTVREVPAGGIWDQAHAERKCPVIAANNKAKWTGNWRKVGANNASVCEIDTGL
ncbi:MAG: mannan-binding protein [Thiolinea sp.]